MCKTAKNIKEQLSQKLKETSNPDVKKAIEDKIKRLGDNETIVK